MLWYVLQHFITIVSTSDWWKPPINNQKEEEYHLYSRLTTSGLMHMLNIFENLKLMLNLMKPNLCLTILICTIVNECQERLKHYSYPIQLTASTILRVVQNSRKVRPKQTSGGNLRPMKFGRQPVAGWHDESFLAVVLIHWAGKVFSLSEDLIFVSRFCQQILITSRFVFSKQIPSARFSCQQFFFLSVGSVSRFLK